ncbi:MAG: EscU/YscU/HrcU family type III secretion system export apparatus switch protein, partial [Gammaproteobacteria bacterium]|nr:EscU/YscU/HrcU family type III secretion system export apparatus switch protein [Gammaproteobacteria bacterium]
MSQDDLDRNQPATPYKLQRAKERGQAAKSADLVAALVFVVAAGYMASRGFDSISAQFRFDLSLLSQAGRMETSAATLWPLISAGLRSVLSALAPFLGALMLAAVVGCLVQTGPILSFEPLKADFGRLHPMQGLRRLFSMRAPFDAVRAVVKLTLLCLVGYLSLKALSGQFYALANVSPIGYLRMLVDDLSAVALRMAGILALIALLDLAFTRREFARKMRMSHRELKDEAKHREGDPRIRARMRELRRELRKRSQAIRR